VKVVVTGGTGNIGTAYVRSRQLVMKSSVWPAGRPPGQTMLSRVTGQWAGSLET
jgi:hypothetical protein